MLFDTASRPLGGITLPPAPRDDTILIHYGKGSAVEALRASTLPPHRFIDVGVDGGSDPRSSTSSSSSTSGVASLRVGALTPLCPSTFNYSSSCLRVQALWLGQEESEAWPPLPVSLSSCYSSSSPPFQSSSSFELRAPVVSREALDAYFSKCGRLRLRLLPLD